MGDLAFEEEEEFRSFSGELGALDHAWLKRLGIETSPAPETEEDTGPTDIIHNAQSLLGLAIQPVDYSQRPDILATYHRNARAIGIDWSLYCTQKSMSLNPGLWLVRLHTARSARFLIAWCCATHLVGEVESLGIGFVPIRHSFKKTELHRLANTFEMCAHLLCPEDRLIRQAATIGISQQMLCRRDWRERVASICPPETLVGVLAQWNGCLPIVIELQLDRYSGLPLLAHILKRLIFDVPLFQLRAIKSGRLFAQTAPLGTRFVDVRFSL